MLSIRKKSVNYSVIQMTIVWRLFQKSRLRILTKAAIMCEEVVAFLLLWFVILCVTVRNTSVTFVFFFFPGPTIDFGLYLH